MVCKECQKEFDSLSSLRRHRSLVHKISSENTYIEYVLGGANPVCKCGCGGETSFLSFEKGFANYIQGHASRINNNWGHNPNALKKSHEKQKELHANGGLIIWNKGLTIDDVRVRDNIAKVMSNPERGKNISKKLLGKQKTTEHKDKLSQKATLRWSSQEERNKQSDKLIKRLIKNNHRNNKTKLELKFQELLNKMGLIENIDYKYQHQLSSAIFDFFILKLNVLIEIDGDFHHCNPDSIHKIPIYPIQIKTVGNDIRKNLIAEQHNIKLLRFWELDIKNNPESVILNLKTELGL